MLLRPRHVSASETTIEDGKPKLLPLSSIPQDGLRCLLPFEATEKNAKKKRSFRRALHPKLHLSRSAVCGGCCLLSASSVFLFTLLRALAMARVVSSADGGVDGAGRMFTVLINTFKRPRQMEQAVRHYAKCHGVESVRVAWSEPSTPPNAATRPLLFDHPTPVRIHAYPTTSINNRFIPPSDLMTEALFVVDDDIAVPCDHLLRAFKTWQQHPDTLVGFFPRSHAYEPPSPVERDGEDKGDGAWEYLYFWRVLWDMEYSIVLTKAAFVHVKYLELYSSGFGSDVDVLDGVNSGGDGIAAKQLQRPGSSGAGSGWHEALVQAMVKTRAYVDSHRNCEDIAMQMAVTSVSGLPPVAAFAPVVDIGLVGGISTGEGSGRWWQAPHAKTRSRCLADLNEIFCAARVTDVPPRLSSPSEDKELQGATGELSPPRCEALVRTNLFATTRAARGTDADVVAPYLRGGMRTTSRGHNDGGRYGGASVGRSDLLPLSRWRLAVRAPTLAEFISADMLLVPAKLWKWFAIDDIFGRSL